MGPAQGELFLAFLAGAGTVYFLNVISLLLIRRAVRKQAVEGFERAMDKAILRGEEKDEGDGKKA